MELYPVLFMSNLHVKTFSQVGFFFIGSKISVYN